MLTITPGANLIGEPRDTVCADLAGLAGTPVGSALVTELRLKSGLVRSIEACAALDRILQLCVEHAASRVQFGCPLAKFQAVQNLVSDIAAEAALARATTEAALSAGMASQWLGSDFGFLVAVARSCSGHATSVVVRNAHQVHGAIGTPVSTGCTSSPEPHSPGARSSARCGTGRTGDRHALYASAGGLWGLITG